MYFRNSKTKKYIERVQDISSYRYTFRARKKKRGGGRGIEQTKQQKT